MRARAAEELRMAEGDFPLLLGGAAAGSTKGGAGAARVLSVNAQTKRVRVESYRAREQVVVPVVVGAEEVREDGGGGRVAPPSREVQYLRVPRGPATRWAVSMGGEGGAAKYVAPPPASAPRGLSDHVPRRRGKGKARDVAGA